MPKRKKRQKEARLDLRLPVEKYNEIFKIYLETQNTAETAARTQVGIKTVQKYLLDGDRERGLMPILHRIQRANKMAQQREDRALAAAKVKYNALVQAQLAWITKSLADTKFNPREGLMEPYRGDLPLATDRLLRLMMYIMGEADQRVEVINHEAVSFMVGVVREVAGNDLARRIGQRIKERLEQDKQYTAGVAGARIEDGEVSQDGQETKEQSYDKGQENEI